MYENILAPQINGKREDPGEKKNGMEVVRLKHAWRGHPVGTIVKVTDACANAMFQKDTAEKIKSENNVAIKDKLRRMVADRRLKTFKKQGTSHELLKVTTRSA